MNVSEYMAKPYGFAFVRWFQNFILTVAALMLIMSPLLVFVVWSMMNVHAN